MAQVYEIELGESVVENENCNRDYGYSYDDVADYTGQDIKNALYPAIKYMIDCSYYAPLISRFRVRVDEHVPKKAWEHMLHDNVCACSDENGVYIDSEAMAKKINDASKKYNSVYENMSNTDKGLKYQVAHILAHEYTHILCQHTRIGRSLNSRKCSDIEWTAHVIATEIEANRAHLVEKNTVLYETSVTEDDFPTTIKCRYYPEIYAEVLRHYKDMEKIMNKLCACAGTAGGEEQENKKNNNKGKGEQENAKGQGSEQERKKSTNSNGDKKENKSSSTSAEITAGEGEKVNGGSTEITKVELSEKEIEEMIEKANNSYSEATDMPQEGGNAMGVGLEAPAIEYDPTLTLEENLKGNYARWNATNIKRELRKLKGLMRGETSKNKGKTYARPSRRKLTGSGLIQKGVRYEKSYSPKVLIALDCSGSMNGTTMKTVATALENIFRDLGKPKTGSFICTHESYVSECVPMKNWRKVVNGYNACGGNDFEEVVKKANELKVDVVLNVGDGQDCCVRDARKGAPCDMFNNSNRKWFDVLITQKNTFSSYENERGYDEKKGFHREAIYLGEEISKILKKGN